MKKLVILALFAALSGCALADNFVNNLSHIDLDPFYRPSNPGTGEAYIFTPDAYGPDLHGDQYGRPVTVQPQPGFGSSGNSYIQTPNAYGPGLHMDQYGRPVTIQPHY